MGRYLTCLVFVIALYVPALPSHAQQPLEKPVGIPRSNQVIKGELTLPAVGKFPAFTAKFEIRDGTLLTIEDHRKENFFFGFSGTINPATENPNIIPWRLDRSPEYGVGIKELGQSGQFNSRVAVAQRDLSVGESRIFPAAGRIRIQISEKYEGAFASPPLADVDLSPEELWAEIERIQEDYGAFGNGGCCMTCQGVTICAGSVSTSCGSCGGGGGGALVY